MSPGLKFAVFTVMLPEYSPEEAAPLLAEIGYQGVEWRVTRPSWDPDAAPEYWRNNRCTVDIATVDQQAAKLAKITRDAGLEMPALGTYMSFRDLEEIERAMRAAAEMGCPRVRISPPRYDRAIGYPRQFARALDGYIEVEKLAKKYQVQACMEIHHGYICSSPSLAQRLLSHFDPRYVAAILDPGNMVREGYEDWRMGMELLGPYLSHVHLKDGQWQPTKTLPSGEVEWEAGQAAMGQGSVDFRQMLTDLRAVSYQGAASFEDFSLSGTTEEKLRRNLAYIQGVEGSLEG